MTKSSALNILSLEDKQIIEGYVGLNEDNDPAYCFMAIIVVGDLSSHRFGKFNVVGDLSSHRFGKFNVDTQTYLIDELMVQINMSNGRSGRHMPGNIHADYVLPAKKW
jgi:hypothetical protein